MPTADDGERRWDFFVANSGADSAVAARLLLSWRLVGRRSSSMRHLRQSHGCDRGGNGPHCERRDGARAWSASRGPDIIVIERIVAGVVTGWKRWLVIVNAVVLVSGKTNGLAHRRTAAAAGPDLAVVAAGQFETAAAASSASTSPEPHPMKAKS